MNTNKWHSIVISILGTGMSLPLLDNDFRFSAFERILITSTTDKRDLKYNSRELKSRTLQA